MRDYYARKKMENEVYGQKEKEELRESYTQSLANKKEREEKHAIPSNQIAGEKICHDISARNSCTHFYLMRRK